MLGRFEGRRAVVTGASRGIGAGIAQRLAAEGADVALVARTLDKQEQLSGSLRETQAACRTYGTQVGVVVADLADQQARARVIPEAVGLLGGTIDIWSTTQPPRSPCRSPRCPHNSSESPSSAT